LCIWNVLYRFVGRSLHIRSQNFLLLKICRKKRKNKKKKRNIKLTIAICTNLKCRKIWKKFLLFTIAQGSHKIKIEKSSIFHLSYFSIFLISFFKPFLYSFACLLIIFGDSFQCLSLKIILNKIILQLKLICTNKKIGWMISFMFLFWIKVFPILIFALFDLDGKMTWIFIWCFSTNFFMSFLSISALYCNIF
jgi:hypothetical protein